MEVTRTLEFPAGHRLLGHEGGCADLHGHNYRVEITVASDKLDSIGRVVDFDDIRDTVGGWIAAHWDHGMLLNRTDPVIETIRPFVKKGGPYLMDNPTAENIAAELYRVARELLGARGVNVTRVRVQEISDCWAEYPGHGAR